MTPFFNDEFRLHALVRTADGWLGTPFHPNGKIPGQQGGVSCQTLVASVYVDAFFLPLGFAIPEGPMNWAHAQKESKVVAFMDGEAMREHFESRMDIQPGDLIGFKLGVCVHHLGIVLTDGMFIHCLKGRGVHLSNIADAFYSVHLDRVWRPIRENQ